MLPPMFVCDSAENVMQFGNWRDWNGSKTGLPVELNGNAIIEYKCRNHISGTPHFARAGLLSWEHLGHAADILQYRVLIPFNDDLTWRAWNGSNGRPAVNSDANTMVEVCLWTGRTMQGVANMFIWTHEGDPADIVAYRSLNQVPNQEPTERPQVMVKKLHPSAIVPQYATPGAACFDLHAFGEEWSEHERKHGVRVGFAEVFRTGLAFEVPKDHVMLIFSRSGHGFKNDIRLSNCVGVIDSDYRGEVQVKLKADASPHHVIHNGDRIAQALVIEARQFDLVGSE